LHQMPSLRKEKKTKKLRGHVNAGHGRVGKHRKHPGGRGNAGGQHHNRLHFTRYHPGYFGKIGMRHFHLKKNQYFCPTINVDLLWSLVSEQTRANYLEKKNPTKAPVIDVTKSGYFKVLGNGTLPDRPVVVKARFFTRMAEEKQADAKSDVMRRIVIEKLVINICVGESGDRLTRASRVLQELTDQRPVFSKARLTVRTFGIRRNEKIACYVTVRGDRAEEILQKGLQVKEFELKDRNFSTSGHFGFGIDEHIDLGLKYDPAIGIYGMDFYVVLGRPGSRVAKRKHTRARVGVAHRVTREDAMEWFKKKWGGHIRVEDKNAKKEE